MATKIVDLHHYDILSHDTKSSGLKVSFDLVARTVMVSKGFFELPRDNKWVKMAGIGNRWEVPVDVILPLPPDNDPGISEPYLVLAYDTQTRKAGIYITNLGEFPPLIKTVEFLASKRPHEGNEWRVRNLYSMPPPGLTDVERAGYVPVQHFGRTR